MNHDPRRLSDDVLTFLSERHLGTLTTIRRDGSPHVVAIGFTFEPDRALVRIITFAASQKVRNIRGATGPRAAVCQVDGGRWLTLEGDVVVSDDPAHVRQAVSRYAERYRQPGEREDRVVIEIAVDRVMGRA
jgi:PPOX class probable F420-dependent enzyme